MNFVEQCNQVVEDYLSRKITETVTNLPNGTTPDDIKANVDEANSYILFVAGEDGELYEQYKFHAFQHEGQVSIVQGKEL